MDRDYRDKRITVVGAGLSGRALTSFFLRAGARVVLSDTRSREEIAGIDGIEEAGAVLDLGGHTTRLFEEADLVVLSPGVPLTVPAVEAASARRVPVIGEIEVAYGEITAPIVAITGTNGKSTTTTLMGEIFRGWGKKTFIGGNLGTPLIDAVEEKDWEWIVAELSSFQLETISRFRPQYALLLNISEDHLDRYPDMSAYVAAKVRVFEKMADSDIAVLNADDSRVADACHGLACRRVAFSSSRLLEEGMGFDGTKIVWRWNGEERTFPVSEMKLKGLHNVENVMAALVPPLMEGCPPEKAWEVVREFSGLPHRMEVVRFLNGVTWYNDSKGTNVGSVVKSLGGLTCPVTLILGGKDKGGDYSPLSGLVKEKVANLLLIGQAAERISERLGELTKTVRVDTMEDAVRTARELTPPGGAVLLSPGCSSFDMFKSYEERGDIFSRCVRALPE